VRSDAEVSEFEEDVSAAKLLRNAILSWFRVLPPAERTRLGLLVGPDLKGVHFHSNRRVTSDGTIRFGLVVQLVQMHTASIGDGPRDFPWGATLVVDVSGRVRFVVPAPPVESRAREIADMQLRARTNALGWALDAVSDPFAVDYRGMHEMRV
jgi:hypothetical protein